jgi:hypothetical protein
MRKRYPKSKFSQNTTNLLSTNVATCFDSRSHHQVNYWTMFEVHQVKVHIFGTSKCLQQYENVDTIEVVITIIIIIIIIIITLTFQSLAVSLRTTRFNTQKFYMVLALRWVFCTDLRTDSGLCFIQHKQIGFYNRGGKCLQRGTDWFLI